MKLRLSIRSFARPIGRADEQHLMALAEARYTATLTAVRTSARPEEEFRRVVHEQWRSARLTLRVS